MFINLSFGEDTRVVAGNTDITHVWFVPRRTVDVQVDFWVSIPALVPHGRSSAEKAHICRWPAHGCPLGDTPGRKGSIPKLKTQKGMWKGESEGS